MCLRYMQTLNWPLWYRCDRTQWWHFLIKKPGKCLQSSVTIHTNGSKIKITIKLYVISTNSLRKFNYELCQKLWKYLNLAVYARLLNYKFQIMLEDKWLLEIWIIEYIWSFAKTYWKIGKSVLYNVSVQCSWSTDFFVSISQFR